MEKGWCFFCCSNVQTKETKGDPKVSDKCVHVFGKLQTNANNQTVKRFACQTQEQTCCKKAQRAVRMFTEQMVKLEESQILMEGS